MREQALTDIRNPVPLSTVSRPPHLKALTSIRFFAASYVALYHMVRPFSLWGIFSGFFAAGYTAVSFFFLLSGFILTYVHAGEYQAGRGEAVSFWVARFARIYPVYALSTIAAGLVYSDLFAKKIHIIAYIADFLMVQTWSARMAPFFNIPAWSLSVEAFFYFLFPYCVLRLKPRTARSADAYIVLLWMAALVVPAFFVLHDPHAAGVLHEYGNKSADLWMYRTRRLPVLLVPIFFAGIVLAWRHLFCPLSRRLSLLISVMGIGGTLATLYLSNRLPFMMLHNGLLLPLFSLTLLGLTQQHALTRILSVAPLVLLGEASYALYLIHFIFEDWSRRVLGWHSDIHDGFIKLLILIPLSIALHLWIERPGRRWILSWWKKRHSTIA